eukprot:467886-Rhodomonas_salina.1
MYRHQEISVDASLERATHSDAGTRVCVGRAGGDGGAQRVQEPVQVLGHVAVRKQVGRSRAGRVSRRDRANGAQVPVQLDRRPDPSACGPRVYAA